MAGRGSLPFFVSWRFGRFVATRILLQTSHYILYRMAENETQAPANPSASDNARVSDPGALARSQALCGDGASQDEEADGPVVLVVHASVGSGHRSAAQAVAQALENMQSERRQGLSTTTGSDKADELLDRCTVKVLDILDFGRIVFDGNRTASLFTGATRPFYDLTWRYTFTGRLLWGGGTIWSHAMYSPFTEYVRKVKPAAIICTHITAANASVSARMLTRQEFPIVSVPTDYETEGLWPHLSTDLFCVASESMAETLRPRRVPDNRIAITGIPTRDDFRRPYDTKQTRTSLGLPLDKRVVLVLAGAYLPRPYVHFRSAIDQVIPYMRTMEDTLHFVLVAGKDREYAEHLRTSLNELGVGNATVLEYVDEMAALMSASDLIICKSGGLTVTECLCSHSPMVLLGRAYGQEKVNVNLLTSLGAALHVTTPRELLDTLRHVSVSPESTRAMLVNGSYLARPNAARDVVSRSLALACEQRSEDDPVLRRHFANFYFGGKPAHIR